MALSSGVQTAESKGNLSDGHLIIICFYRSRRQHAVCAVRHQLVCSVIKKGTDNIVYVTSKEAVNMGCHPPGNQWKSPVTIQDSDTRKVSPFTGAYHWTLP